MYCKTRKTTIFPWSGMDPEAPEPEVMGNCMTCGEELREDYTYFGDRDGNVFCSLDCAVKFCGIEEKDW